MTERALASGESDRRGFLRGAVAAVAVVGVGVLFSGSAYAVEGRSRVGRAGAIELPPVGTEIPVSCYVANVPLRLNALGILTLDFKGGINYLVKTSTAEGADLEVQDFRVEADTSPSTPDSGHLVVLKKSSTHLAPISVLKADGQMLIHLPLDVETIDKATGETVISGSTDPAKYATLVSADQSGNQAPVNAFPPVNQNYVLQEPVSFYTPGSTDPDAQVGTLEAFGAVMNQSA